MAVGNEFRHESRLGDRFRNYHALGQCRDESYWGLAVSGNPSHGSRFTRVIADPERRGVGYFTNPMRVGEAVRMLMRWIAIVDVKKRSLSEGEQKARSDAMMDCAPHSQAL